MLNISKCRNERLDLYLSGWSVHFFFQKLKVNKRQGLLFGFYVDTAKITF